MKKLLKLFKQEPSKSKVSFLKDFFHANKVTDDGVLIAEHQTGFLFEADGVDHSLFTESELQTLHNEWRSALQWSNGEEIQIIFRKRVEFAQWVEEQLKQSFLSDNMYGRRILLDRLANQVKEMSQMPPHLLSQKIFICFWVAEKLEASEYHEKRNLIKSQLASFGFDIKALNKREIEQEIFISSYDLTASEEQEPEWPSIKIEADHLLINEDSFKALELKKLPERFTELGMIQAITSLPYPMDICLRLKAREIQPVVRQLEKKRNLLNAKRMGKEIPLPHVESQLEQINQVLRQLADSSETLFDMKMTIGVRLPKDLNVFHRKALATIIRSGSQMDFCEFEEATINTFDSYLECLPGFSGENIKTHTVLG
ncbi:MAG: hypothetical protein D6797_08875, partial [Bdellovibrio sp.]